MVEREHLSRRPDVTLLKKIDFMFLAYKYPTPNVKFSIFDQKRFLNIFLNDEGTTF